MSHHPDEEPHMKSVGDEDLDEAIEEIDASMFSGDMFEVAETALTLHAHLQRWELVLLKKFMQDGQIGERAPYAKPFGNRHIDQAIEAIDAAIFTGDRLDDINAALRLQKYLHRWERGLLKKFTPEGQRAEFDPTAY